MGFMDSISRLFDEEAREKAKVFNNGRSLTYVDPAAGVKLMEEGCVSKRDFERTAAFQWQKVKDEKGEDAAKNDPDFKRLMGLAARAKG